MNERRQELLAKEESLRSEHSAKVWNSAELSVQEFGKSTCRPGLSARVPRLIGIPEATLHRCLHTLSPWLIIVLFRYPQNICWSTVLSYYIRYIPDIILSFFPIRYIIFCGFLIFSKLKRQRRCSPGLAVVRVSSELEKVDGMGNTDTREFKITRAIR